MGLKKIDCYLLECDLCGELYDGGEYTVHFTDQGDLEDWLGNDEGWFMWEGHYWCFDCQFPGPICASCGCRWVCHDGYDECEGDGDGCSENCQAFLFVEGVSDRKDDDGRHNEEVLPGGTHLSDEADV